MKIIKNGILITPEGEKRADLAIKDSIIAEIGDISPADGDEVYDAGGC